MLRRRLSAGALRAQAQAQIHSNAPSTPRKAGVTATSAAAKATISPREQSKSLGSVVLLNTQRNWKGETVVTLKAELKKRGLSQVGNKATLVSRLQSADTTGLAPPVPPVNNSRVLRAEAKMRANQARSYATPATETPPPDSAQPVITTSEDVAVNAPGAEVKVSEPTPAEKTSAPGLPVKKPLAGDEFTIYFPEPRPDKEIPQIIPTLPHTITSTKTRPLADDIDENFGLPKVVTVAPAATHPEGGPVLGGEPVSELEDASESAPKRSVNEDDLTAQVIEKAQEQIAAAKRATDEILQLSGLSETVQLPKQEGDGQYKATSKPLSPEERNGAWILGGVIGAVLLLGGVGGKKKPEESKETKETGKVKEKA